MRNMRNAGKILVCTLLYLVVFDLAGVALCFFFEVAPVRRSSTALLYVIWLVLGVFCGLLSYNTAGKMASPKSDMDWSTREDSGKTGILVVLTTSVVLIALSAVFYLLLWQRSPESSFFVPDNASPTLTFFAAVLASAVFAHKALRSVPSKTVKP